MKQILRRPSPAMAVACTALFVALGGVSYGVATGSIDSREIRDNTIRSKDIRNNSVYTRDIRNNDVRDIDIRNGTIKGRDIAKGTITGDNVNMAKLGAVGDSAALGGVAAKDYARVAEPVHLVGAPGEPAFGPGFAPAGGADLAPGFWRSDAVVQLQGTVAGGPGVAFTLPAAYRPAGSAHYGTVTVEADGDVVVVEPDPPVPAVPTSLDGISFRAAP